MVRQKCGCDFQNANKNKNMLHIPATTRERRKGNGIRTSTAASIQQQT